MPVGSFKIDAALSNLAVKYTNNEAIFQKFLPIIPVQRQSDVYWVYTPNYRLPNTVRGNKSPANTISFEASTSSYYCPEHALKDVVSDRDVLNADSIFDLRVDTTENLTDTIIQRMEYETAKLLFTTSTFSQNGSLNTASSWVGNTTTNSPCATVLSATNAILKNGGVKANTMILGKAGFDAVKENTNLHERIKYVERSIITEDLLAAVFDLQNVYVGTMIYDTGPEGIANSITYIWTEDKALVAYFEPARRKTRSAAAGFRVMQYGNPYRVKRWREEDIEGEYIECQTMFVPKAVATLSAYLLSSITGV